ncbi:MAG: LytTR family DNA-binding domain-containing protein [Bacteroidales bacterium]
MAQADDTRIRTVIVEDERKSLLTLETLLNRYCPEVEVVGSARSVEEGLFTLKELNPELVFLDISMPDGDAFDLLNSLPKISFEIIFITAYNNFALKAFEFSALHYLLKPVNYLDLQEAVTRFQRIRPVEDISPRIEVMKSSLANHFDKISLPTGDGLIFIEIERIVRIEASHNYSIFYLSNQESIIVTRASNHYENLLRDHHFVRIHNAHLVNLRFVRKYVKGQGGSILLTDGTTIAVARARKASFLESLKCFTLGMGVTS